MTYTIEAAPATPFTLAIRIPAWSANSRPLFRGQPQGQPAEVRHGYAYITRTWQPGDTFTLELDMTPRRVYAHPQVRAAAGCTTVMRGPLVYCLEQADNGENLAALRLPRQAPLTAHHTAVEHIGEVTTLTAPGLRQNTDNAALYSPAPPTEQPTTLHFVPYYAWGNRPESAGTAMRVWVRE